MSDPSSPPSPGMPPDVYAAILAATWTDSHYVTGTLGAPGSGAYSIDRDTDARLRAATRQTDGSFADASGQHWWLGVSGAMAVAVNV